VEPLIRELVHDALPAFMSVRSSEVYFSGLHPLEILQRSNSKGSLPLLVALLLQSRVVFFEIRVQHYIWHTQDAPNFLSHFVDVCVVLLCNGGLGLETESFLRSVINGIHERVVQPVRVVAKLAVIEKDTENTVFHVSVNGIGLLDVI
jgi:hypothetical protein